MLKWSIGENKNKSFSELKRGETFIWDRFLYMKTDNIIYDDCNFNAIILTDGTLAGFDEDTKVCIVDINVRVEIKTSD